MRKQTNGTTTIGELAILAGSIGLVENTEDGRQAFSAWWANDKAAARKALFSRVAARRVAASASKAAGTGSGKASAGAQPTAYPKSWGRRTLGAASGLRVQRGQR